MQQYVLHADIKHLLDLEKSRFQSGMGMGLADIIWKFRSLPSHNICMAILYWFTELNPPLFCKVRLGPGRQIINTSISSYMAFVIKKHYLSTNL